MKKTKQENNILPVSAESLLMALPNPAFYFDNSGICGACNTSAVEILGVASEQVITGITMAKLASKFDCSEAIANNLQSKLKAVVEKGGNETLSRANKQNRQIQFDLRPLKNERENIIGVLLLANYAVEQDTEEQQRQQFFEDIIAVMPGSIYWLDSNSVYRGCNDECAKLLGLKSRFEINGETVYTLGEKVNFPIEAAKKVAEQDAEIIRTGQAKLNIEETPFTDVEGRLWHQLTNKVPLRDVNGNVTGILGVSINMADHKKIEAERMKQQQQFFEDIVAAMPGSVYWLDKSGVYMGCNDEGVRMTGLKSRDDIKGETIYTLLEKVGAPLEVAEKVAKLDEEIIRTGQPKFNIEEVPFTDVQGRVWHQLTNKVPLRDVNGNVTGILGVSINIIDRKKMEEERIKQERQRQQQFEDIIAAMPGSVYWLDKNNIYMGCNDEAAKILGLKSRHDVKGMTLYELKEKINTSLEVIEVFRKSNDEVMRTGRPQFNVEEAPFTDNQGRVLYQLTNKVPLRDISGNITGVLCASIDISERKRQASEKEILFENIVANMPGSVYWINREGVYVGCNDEAAKLSGLNSRDDVLGETIYSFCRKVNLPEEVAELAMQLDMSIMDTGVPRINIEEEPFIDSRGNAISQLTNKVPLRDGDGNITGLLGISINITDRKKSEQERLKAEQAEVRSRTIRQLAGQLSHDIAPSINTIRSCSVIVDKTLPKLIEAYQLADSHRLNPPPINNFVLRQVADSITTIKKQGNSMLEFLNTMLINIKSGKELQHNIGKHAIETIVNDTVASLRYTLGEQKHNKIHVDIDHGFVISANEDLMRRVVINLINNALYAIEAASKGEIWLYCQKTKEFNQLVIKDTGTGIAKMVKSRIFEFGFTTKPKNVGSGIGLHACRSIMESIGGFITFETKENAYTSFFLNFPPVKGDKQ
ncbi:MAG: PAS domain-containing protein [Pseudomonadota bacterium]